MSCQDGASGVHQANADADLTVLGQGSTQGLWLLPLTPHPEATQLSFFLYVSVVPRAAIPP